MCCCLEALIDTPGIGGAIAGAVIVTLVTCYGLTIWWIAKGRDK